MIDFFRKLLINVIEIEGRMNSIITNREQVKVDASHPPRAKICAKEWRSKFNSFEVLGKVKKRGDSPLWFIHKYRNHYKEIVGKNGNLKPIIQINDWRLRILTRSSLIFSVPRASFKCCILVRASFKADSWHLNWYNTSSISFLWSSVLPRFSAN